MHHHTSVMALALSAAALTLTAPGRNSTRFVRRANPRSQRRNAARLMVRPGTGLFAARALAIVAAIMTLQKIAIILFFCIAGS